MVKNSISRGTSFLATMQNGNGSFGTAGLGRGTYPVGPSALCTLALLNSGVSPQDPVIAKALGYLRSFHDPGGTYETSLVLMALVAAKDWDRDKLRIATLAERLEGMQTTRGPVAGMWNYGHGPYGGGGEDNSNTQFAVLGLREAAIAGIKIRRKTWELTLKHFVDTQNGDGGWGYHVNDPSTGSMTCSGIGSLVICEQMLGSTGDDTNPDGTPKCCNQSAPHDDRAAPCRGMVRTLFCRRRESGTRSELGPLLPVRRRAGRPPFGPAVLRQSRLVPRRGQLPGRRADRDREEAGTRPSPSPESDQVVASSFALLFLSKGLAPVLINKLNYGSGQAQRADDDTLPNWNLHPNDIRNLTEYVSSSAKVAQAADLSGGRHRQGRRLTAAFAICLQAPILYISGLDEPKFTDAQVQLLRAYVEQGGFIFAVNNCNGAGFDEGIKSLVSRIYARRRPVQATAARTSDLPRRISARPRGDGTVGRRFRLPDVVRLCAARSFVPVGQVVATAGAQAHGGLQPARAESDESGSQRGGLRDRTRALRQTRHSSGRNGQRRQDQSSGACCKSPSCGTRATGTRLREPCTTC